MPRDGEAESGAREKRWVAAVVVVLVAVLCKGCKHTTEAGVVSSDEGICVQDIPRGGWKFQMGSSR